MFVEKMLMLWTSYAELHETWRVSLQAIPFGSRLSMFFGSYLSSEVFFRL